MEIEMLVGEYFLIHIINLFEDDVEDRGLYFYGYKETG